MTVPPASETIFVLAASIWGESGGLAAASVALGGPLAGKLVPKITFSGLRPFIVSSLGFFYRFLHFLSLGLRFGYIIPFKM